MRGDKLNMSERSAEGVAIGRGGEGYPVGRYP